MNCIDIILICKQAYKEKAEQCNYKGDLQCGVCQCGDAYSGQKCECEASTAGLGDFEASCRADNTSDIVCSGRGACVCGLCECSVNGPNGGNRPVNPNHVNGFTNHFILKAIS